jgi:hypothetical protein
MRKVCLYLVGVVVLGIFCALSFWAGVIYKEVEGYRYQTRREEALIEPILKSDAAYSHIGFGNYSGGGAVLYGYVASENDLSRLREAIIRAVGETHTERILRNVSVKK